MKFIALMFLASNLFAAGGVQNVRIMGDNDDAIVSARSLRVAVSSISPTATSVTSPVYTEIGDSDEGKTVFVTSLRELKTVNPVRLIGVSFNKTEFEASFISSAIVNGSTITVSSGCINLRTGTAADASAIVQTTRIARYLAGSSNEARMIVRITTTSPTVGTNVRQWGAYNGDNGFFFQFKNGAFYVGAKKDGVEIPVATGSGLSTSPSGILVMRRIWLISSSEGVNLPVFTASIHIFSRSVSSPCE